jgi:hypothetical protein
MHITKIKATSRPGDSSVASGAASPGEDASCEPCSFDPKEDFSWSISSLRSMLGESLEAMTFCGKNVL